MKDLKIKFTPEAASLFLKLRPDNKKMIKTGLKVLRQNPDLGGDLQGELSGFKSYKIRRYRILYKIAAEEKIIQIYYLGHRRDVYEQFQMLLNSFSS